MSQPIPSEITSHWIFGYGSLIWRPDFPFVDRRIASIEGWARRYWQGSTDHRGVPGAPGRVVTLIEAPGEICWGMAYRVADEVRDEVIAHLDYREKGGYRLEQVELLFADINHAPKAGLMYHAAEGNPNYLGEASPADIAAQVQRSRGPSGENLEYVVELAEALRAIGAEDSHVFEIERLALAGS